MTCPKTKTGGIAMKSSHWDLEGMEKTALLIIFFIGTAILLLESL